MSDEAKQQAEQWVDKVFCCDNESQELCRAARSVLLRVATRAAEEFACDFCKLKEEPVLVMLPCPMIAMWREPGEGQWFVVIEPVKHTEDAVLPYYAHELGHVVLRHRDPGVSEKEKWEREVGAWEKAAEWFPKEAGPVLKNLVASLKYRKEHE